MRDSTGVLLLLDFPNNLPALFNAAYVILTCTDMLSLKQEKLQLGLGLIPA